ncbi:MULTISPECIES: protocatechuate 3,4-dioxygenase subunit alpha [unclassified Variovorax]|jgi:protocatechuate 3,4-dioxygenase alpha subunit|uniref:protocatechuate 3,4-dioxygenase subunit alpha n=1 Tax=unclassified Variovorax TaxID=663243 RepID=UPI0025753999|nr:MULTISPECIES: protocatechuate 3,4-dioxygenase subunit alpha [unclassified Variovorax]MDM0089589.1 protocatechuate 3,4-dioxygenase subunit alpha [Variovorax sp. J22G40]MDM0147661.1 protocatechuate 3,4-dioxygenase subunit alpha [Variovorax sp. J2P1-31]
MMSALESNFGQTPSQTVGPYFAYGLTATQYGYDFDQPFDATLALDGATGERIRLEGRVIDGDGQPIFDAMIEISQPDGEGRYPRSVEEAQARGFRAFGRCGTGTDAQKRFVFHTVKPGAEAPGEAPHINVIVTMRGLLLHAFTRIYFSDEAAANAGDAVLQSVPAARRPTLVAERIAQDGAVTYRFDIRMQGADETVFFDI